ncbi:MAG: adenosylmethionine-8-amino-7-oxononanoate transaminase [Bacteroidetes bacterium]|jgi:adenosylmethionine-8-amino-7-oxononanoate aminotransferase|nr:adenosylmethionine-8-amino-7-oxononanoate transaminase [Bacteroidota bacterium]
MFNLAVLKFIAVSSILHNDNQYVWHPFTHLKYAEEPVHLVRGEGAYFYDADGNKLLDAISSWWVNLHGHCHPYISQKVSEQLQTLEHAIFSSFTHTPAVTLAERLIGHLPDNQSKIFYSDNGSTAVEVGLKMVLQYWHNQGTAKKKFIAFENAYHGDTFGGMSVGARNVFNNAFDNLLFDVIHIPLPDDENIEDLKATLQSWFTNHDDIAGFIFEPLVQGAAGMLMYEAKHLDELIGLCQKNRIICIADEVMTGFGRTGKFFASNYLHHHPDIICLSKGLTGGYMPLGVTACAQFIYDSCVSDDKTKTFFHGHSYTANPTACSAALASLDLMEKEGTWEQIRMISGLFTDFVSKNKYQTLLKDVRSKGTILALEIGTNEHTHYLNSASDDIATYFLKRNIIVRPLGNVLYLIPPYCISKQELQEMLMVCEDFFNK